MLSTSRGNHNFSTKHRYQCYFFYQEIISWLLRINLCILVEDFTKYEKVVQFKESLHYLYIEDQTYPYQQWEEFHFRLNGEGVQEHINVWEHE